MRVPGVVVVDGYPFELRPEVRFDVAHQPPRELPQVPVLHRVVDRDDHPELVAVLGAAREERLAVGLLLGGTVQLARQPLACHAVALDVAQVHAGCVLAPAGHPDDASLDDHASRPRAAIAVTAAQHPRHASATPDPATGERLPPGREATAAAARECERPHRLVQVAPAALAPARADLAEPRFEV